LRIIKRLEMIIKLCYFFSNPYGVQQSYGFEKRKENNQREKGIIS
jgi:hypothetical protein